MIKNPNMIPCFHCHLKVPQKTDFCVIYNNIKRKVCCAGCQAVAEMIIANGLSDYYEFRDKPALSMREMKVDDWLELSLFDEKDSQQEYVTERGGLSYASLLIEGLTCAACIWLLEKKIRTMPGVMKFSVSLSQHIAHLTWDNTEVKLSTILAMIKQLGFIGHFYRPILHKQSMEAEKNRQLKRLAVAGLGFMQVMTFSMALYLGAFQGIEEQYKIFFQWISMIFTFPIVIYAAFPIFKNAWQNVASSQISMDLPIALALGFATIMSVYNTLTHQQEVYYDSVTMFIFFVVLARFIELCARQRCAETVFQLHSAMPLTANVWDGQSYKSVMVEQLKTGDIILVRPGETVPADGIVKEGLSTVDEALLTGEVLPIVKVVGSSLIGGSQNLENPLVMSITIVGHGTRLGKIIHLIENAAHFKPPIVKLSNKIAGYFIFCVLAIALLSAVVWWYVDPYRIFSIVFSVLVVSCPCALSLATPVALISATNRLAKVGFLIQSDHVLESLSCLTDVVFDKTGTLTKGQFKIQSLILLGEECEKTVMQMATVLEEGFDHPIRNAFLRQNDEIDSSIVIKDRVNFPGQGIEGKINGIIYRIGQFQFVQEICKNKELPSHPCTPGIWILLAKEMHFLAWFQLHDEPAVNCNALVHYFNERKITTHLLTGDNSEDVIQFAKTLQIKKIKKGARPNDKLDYITKLQHIHPQTLMLGDGINDAPVLKSACVSITMGNGSDLAKIHADAILLNDDLIYVTTAIDLAIKTKRILRQNIFWSVCYNFTAILFAAFGMIPPYLAAIGMSLSSLFVIVNSQRCNRI